MTRKTSGQMTRADWDEAAARHWDGIQPPEPPICVDCGEPADVCPCAVEDNALTGQGDDAWPFV